MRQWSESINLIFIAAGSHCLWEVIDIKDRQVQYPNRFRATPVSGQEDVYDLTPVPGTVTQAGTSFNKANLLSDATATLLGLSDDPTINDALAGIGTSLKAKPKWYQLGSYSLSAVSTGSITLSLSDYLDNYKAIHVYFSGKKSGSGSSSLLLKLGSSSSGETLITIGLSSTTLKTIQYERNTYLTAATYSNFSPLVLKMDGTSSHYVDTATDITDWHYNKMYFYNQSSSSLQSGLVLEVYGLK